MRSAVRSVLLLFLSSGFCFFFLPSFVVAEQTGMLITSDSLEYFGETNQYVANGSVEIIENDTVITADRIIYEETTSGVLAEGRVRYHDPEISIKAEKAELNLEKKTGRLFDADVFYKEGNYYLTGNEIEKKGENAYYSPSAFFTTCDAPVPAWCVHGKDVDIVLGERLKAKNTSFRIKNVPVLHAPYVWAPIFSKRQTGFLMPVVSQSNSRGLGLKIPFYWVISGNRDATFVLDTYSKRGTGVGMEYRFIMPAGEKGYLWTYYIRDRELKENFWEVKGLYENRSSWGRGGFLNINLLNEKNFYREFSSQLETRTQRFLESTGEMNFPAMNSRFYLLSQYWIDLKYDTADVPQKLPEIGYVLNYTNVGGPLMSATVTAANIWSDGGLSAARIDVHPKLLYSFGKDFVVSQRAVFRATGYSFYRQGNTVDKSTLRTAFKYDLLGHTRLTRKYGQVLHVVEPSISYHFIASSDNNLPVFDVTELYRKTSLLELSVLNRLVVGETEVATMRITQAMDTYQGARPFLPLKLELGVKRWIPIKFNTTYNVHVGRFETVNSEVGFPLPRGYLTLGQTYYRAEDIMVYKGGLSLNPFKRILFNSSIWYDAKGGGLREMNISLKYQQQCWGLSFQSIKSPGDFTMMVLLELAGLNSKPLKETDNAAQGW